MKCPYQTEVIHQPQYEQGYTTVYAKDTTRFAACLKDECPFYYTEEYRPTGKITEHCRRAEAESEVKPNEN